MTLASHPGCNPLCRACHYKDLSYAEQLARKNAWAGEQLSAWGALLCPIREAPPEDRVEYRSKSWMRAQSDGGRISFGFYRAVRQDQRWGQEFVSWDGCPIHAPAIREGAARLAAALAREAPEVREAILGLWVGIPDLVLVLRTGASTDPIRRWDWSELLIPPLTRAWLYETTQVGSQAFQHREFRSLAGSPPPGPPPMRAFRQVARALLREARGQAVAALLAPRPGQVVDLYCGTGELAALLPPEVAWIGIEQSLDAVRIANESLRRPGRSLGRDPDRDQAFTGSVADRLRDPRVRERIRQGSSLYLNPPRSGLGEDGRRAVVDLIRNRRPRILAYLSCSASSLARDLPALENAGCRVTSLQPFDFFPHTEHFETLAVLEAAP